MSTDASRREFLLAMMRVASVRLRLMVLELEEVGVALKHNMITPEDGVVWLDDIGALDLVNAAPWTNKVEVAA